MAAALTSTPPVAAALTSTPPVAAALTSTLFGADHSLSAAARKRAVRAHCRVAVRGACVRRPACVCRPVLSDHNAGVLDHPSWEDWLDALDAPTRNRALRLHDRFRSLGVPDAEIWARSEVSEDLAQLATLLFLRAVWARIDRWNESDAVEILPGVDELRRAGVDTESLRAIARRVAYETALGVVVALDRVDADDFTEPGWVLMEADENGASTGRDLVGLHESFHDADPSGRGAADLLRSAEEDEDNPGA